VCVYIYIYIYIYIYMATHTAATEHQTHNIIRHQAVI